MNVQDYNQNQGLSNYLEPLQALEEDLDCFFGFWDGFEEYQPSECIDKLYKAWCAQRDNDAPYESIFETRVVSCTNPNSKAKRSKTGQDLINEARSKRPPRRREYPEGTEFEIKEDIENCLSLIYE